MVSVTNVLLALTAGLGAQGVPDSLAPAQPVFASHEILNLRLATDLKTTLKDIGKDHGDFEFEGEGLHPATLSYLDADGNPVVLDVDVSTRGHFRRHPRNCNFPPLRLRFKPDRPRGTIFEGQNKLKLVTHCRDKQDESEQYVLLEYLVYRSYMLLTDKSSRVRLARTTYVDTEGKRDSLTTYSFLIEDDDRMAARNGASVLDSLGVHQADTDDEHGTLVALFQYFIGQADWKVSALHNIKLLNAGSFLPIMVPFDFDFSGVVDAKYASPPEELGTQSVRERVFISPCRTTYDLNRVFGLFNDRKDAIYALYTDQEGLYQKQVKRTLTYFDQFYKRINDPKDARRVFLRRGCPEY